MITIVYTVTREQKESELEWLREQKIFPSVAEGYEWTSRTSVYHIGCIVNPTAAVAIKMRHKLDIQVDYKQR